MTWEVEQKKVRGAAEKRFHSMSGAFRSSLVDGTETPVIYVRFDKSSYDPRAGKEIHGKLYESPEEAIQELGARIVERVLRDDEEVPVTVSISLPKWVEE